MKYTVTYKAQGKTYTNDSPLVRFQAQEDLNEIRLDAVASVPLNILKAEIDLGDCLNDGEMFLANGYQTWTWTKELSPLQHVMKLGFLARSKKVQDKFHLLAYGDYTFAKYRPHYSYSYTYLRNNEVYRLYGSLSERNGYTVFYLKNRELWAEKDMEGVELKGNFNIFDIFQGSGDEKTAFDAYQKALKIVPLHSEKLTGFTTWYRHYDKVSQKDIEKDLADAEAKKLPFRIFQIDDGYQKKTGDWLDIATDKFPSGMEYLAQKISSMGMIPGLWIAPFVAAFDSKLVKEHPEWILKDSKGNYVYQGCNWNGAYALDMQKKEVKDYIHTVFQTYIKAGYKLFKLDFLYACCQVPYNNKSRGQLMCEAMDFIHEELKDQLVLGCGVPLFPAFGKVDYCRIGMDVSLRWNDLWWMKFTNRERISTKNALDNMYYRRELSGRFFMNDPDVILMVGTKMSDKQKEKLYQRAKETGGVYFTSDDLSLYTDKELAKWNELKKESEHK